MNLNANPTVNQLRRLIGQFDDTAHHHLLWVKTNGEVAITPLSKKAMPDDATIEFPDMKLKCETFLAGNEYVGPDAAANDEWMHELFDMLTQKWAEAKGRAELMAVTWL